MDELVGRHRRRLVAMLELNVPDGYRGRVSAEDVVQEVCLESVRKIGTFDLHRASSFYPWLVGIAKRKLSEAVRAAGAAKRAKQRLLSDSHAADETSLPGRLARKEDVDTLVDAIQALAKDQALAIKLRYLEAKSIRETAAAMGRSEAAVKALVRRGFQQLASRIKPSS